MNSFVETIWEKRIEKTIQALGKNNMTAYFIPTREELLAKIQELIPEESTVAWGGSATLKEAGIDSLLKNGSYTCYDRTQPGLSAEEYKRISRQAFSADFFLAGANAITEQGQIYNVDGNGNRVAPMIYGPDRVIVVAGKNKLVPDLEASKVRVQKLAAPVNGLRLGTETPCCQLGECIGGDGCHAPKRMCCTYTTFGYQRDKNRITVLITMEDFGF